jgi:hypothetical protein
MVGRNEWVVKDTLRAEVLKFVKRKSGLSWVRTVLGAESREGDDRRYSPTSTGREEFKDEKELESHC